MKERPILFNGPMVRGVLSGQKTVTRRVMKKQPCRPPKLVENGGANFWANPLYIQGAWMGSQSHACPYGQPGDRLWVREAWAADAQIDAVSPRDLSRGEPIMYPADRAVRQTGCSMIAPGKTRPSIHLPRWASRILLEITDVRVERLRDTADLALLDELGDMLDDCDSVAGKEFSRIEHLQSAGAPLSMLLEMYGFKAYWDQANGAGSFDTNPWVWVVEFKRVTP